MKLLYLLTLPILPALAQYAAYADYHDDGHYLAARSYYDAPSYYDSPSYLRRRAYAYSYSPGSSYEYLYRRGLLDKLKSKSSSNLKGTAQQNSQNAPQGQHQQKPGPSNASQSLGKQTKDKLRKKFSIGNLKKDKEVVPPVPPIPNTEKPLPPPPPRSPTPPPPSHLELKNK